MSINIVEIDSVTGEWYEPEVGLFHTTAGRPVRVSDWDYDSIEAVEYDANALNHATGLSFDSTSYFEPRVKINGTWIPLKDWVRP